MEIRPVEGEGCRPGGYVVEVLGQVEFREMRHEACEAALAILEREIDRLRLIVEGLRSRCDQSGESGDREDPDGRKTKVVRDAP